MALSKEYIQHLKTKKYLREYKNGNVDFLFVPQLVQKNVLTNYEYSYLKHLNHWSKNLNSAS